MIHPDSALLRTNQCFLIHYELSIDETRFSDYSPSVDMIVILASSDDG